jgi:hypothetical protein
MRVEFPAHSRVFWKGEKSGGTEKGTENGIVPRSLEKEANAHEVS